MNPGQKVRIITDPGRVGVLSERKQEHLPYLHFHQDRFGADT